MIVFKPVCDYKNHAHPLTPINCSTFFILLCTKDRLIDLDAERRSYFTFKRNTVLPTGGR